MDKKEKCISESAVCVKQAVGALYETKNRVTAFLHN